MVTVKQNSIIIEIKHPCPDELKEDLLKAGLASLRAICDDIAMDASLMNEEEFGDVSSALLDLLYAMILDKEE